MPDELPIHVPRKVHSSVAHIHIFIDSSDAVTTARGLGPILERMPPQHAEVFDEYLIFVIEEKPGGGRGGGTWRPREVLGAFQGRESRTGASDDELQRLVLGPHRGLIGIPRERWERGLDQAKLTVLHEVGHAVDYAWDLAAPGAVENDYRGARPVCGGSGAVERRAVEAYARWVLGSSRICRDEVEGETTQVSDRRIIALLRRSPAFTRRNVPETWVPPRR